MSVESDFDPSDSAIQREIELVMLGRVAEQNRGWQRVIWKEVAVEFGLSVVWQKSKPDAVWKTESGGVIVAESYARVDKLAAGHRRKLAMDALKLLALRHAFPDGAAFRSLIVVPKGLMAELNGDNWFSLALRLAAEIVPVELSDNEKKMLYGATMLQALGQARTKRAKKDQAQ